MFVGLTIFFVSILILYWIQYFLRLIVELKIENNSVLLTSRVGQYSEKIENLSAHYEVRSYWRLVFQGRYYRISNNEKAGNALIYIKTKYPNLRRGYGGLLKW